MLAYSARYGMLLQNFAILEKIMRTFSGGCTKGMERGGMETDRVALLGVGDALRHDNHGGPIGSTCHDSNAEALFPALHDPYLQKLLGAQVVHL